MDELTYPDWTPLGHDEIFNQFLESWNQGRLHHAWLISGIRSVGKNGFAHCLARFILSHRHGQQASLDDIKNINRNQQDIKLYFAGSHPNFLYISPLAEKLDLKAKGKSKGDTAKHMISMESARKITNFFALSSDLGQYRVVIIDSIDDMNINATNAILKTLEEPPARTVFLLISHNPEKLLPTIISRCRRLPLNGLSNDKILSLLPETISDVQRSIIPWLAQGSAGQALFFLEEEKVNLWNQTLEIFIQVSNNNISSIPFFIKQFERNNPQIRENLIIFLQYWMRLLHALTLVSAGQAQNLPEPILAITIKYENASLENCLNVFDKSHKIAENIMQEMGYTSSALSQLLTNLHHINT